MRFVNDDGVVLIQKRVLPNFSEQNSIGHQFYICAITDLIGKSNLESNRITHRRIQFTGNSCGNASGRDSSGLRMPDQARSTTTSLHTDLGQLSGFSRTGFPANNDYLVFFDGCQDIFTRLNYG